MVMAKQNLSKRSKTAQMKIQQMAFMILAVFLFFIIVGLFFITIEFKDMKKSADQLNTESAISSLQTLVNLPELSFYGETNSLDEDKLRVMSSSVIDYSEFWPVASIKVYKIYPSFDRIIKCPAVDCNYYEIYNSRQKDVYSVSTFVSICRKVNEFGHNYDRCELGKLEVGVIKNEE
jgi:hypothetical protein